MGAHLEMRPTNGTAAICSKVGQPLAGGQSDPAAETKLYPGLSHFSECDRTVLFAERTCITHGPDFNLDAVRQAGTLFGDGHRLVQRVQPKHEISADGFLGFGK